jgi:hypothetical protein
MGVVREDVDARENTAEIHEASHGSAFLGQIARNRMMGIARRSMDASGLKFDRMHPGDTARASAAMP